MRLHQHRGHVITAEPAVEPVTAAELRDTLRESSAGLSDTQANDLIATARVYLEQITGLACITQEWLLALDHWPMPRGDWWDGVRQLPISELYSMGRPDLTLPRYPLQSVDAVTVYAENSASTSITVATVFDVDTRSRPGRMTLKHGQTWPIALRASNAIEIGYTAGFGNEAADVPAPIKRAIRSMAAHLYEHRGDGCSVSDAWKDSGAAAMAATYAVRGV
jgi:uncharacterized phiE125 gp8 family phage protein